MPELSLAASHPELTGVVRDLTTRVTTLWGRWQSRLVATTLVVVCVFEVTGTFEVGSAMTGLPLYILTLAGMTLLAIVVGLRHRQILAAPVLGYGAMVLATVVSYQRSLLPPAVTAPGVTEALKNLLFVVALAVLAARLVPWRTLALTLTATTGGIGYLSGLNEFVLGRSASFGGFDTVTKYEGVGFEAGRHAGPMPDPNFWGRELVAVIPFAVALVRDAWLIRREHPRRAAVQAVVGLWGLGGQAIAIYLTGSRGAYVSFAVAVAVALLASGVRLRWLALGAAIVGPIALAVPGVASRLFSFSLSQSGLTQSAGVDASVMERLATQRVALAMASNNLLSGVGPDGYFPAFGHYGALTQQALARVVAPHNLYLGTAAELGLLGLTAWLLTVGTAIWLALQATARTTAPQRPYAAAVLAGIVAWSVASIFLHASHIRIILALTVLAAAVNLQTRRHPVAIPRVPVDVTYLLRERPRLAAAVITGATLGALLFGAAAYTAGSSYRATATGRLVPVGSDRYLLDLRTRSAVVTTYAVFHELPDENVVDVQGDPASGLMSLSTSARSENAARRQVNSAVTGGAVIAQRSTMSRLYRSEWGPVQIHHVHSQTATLFGAGGGLLLGGAVPLVIARRSASGEQRLNTQRLSGR